MDTISQISALVIIIVALCEGMKVAGLSVRWIPLLSVLLGIFGSFLVDGVSFLSVASGVILGVATTGGYRVIKTSILNK